MCHIIVLPYNVHIWVFEIILSYYTLFEHLFFSGHYLEWQ